LTEDGAQLGEVAAAGAEEVEELFDGPGGEDATTSINPIDNYLGFPEGIGGVQLANLAMEQLKNLPLVHFGLDLNARYLKRDPEEPERYLVGVWDEARSEVREVRAGIVLIASGRKPNILKLPSNREHVPDRGVYYSALPCDQERERDRRVVVIGGGNSAGQAALQFHAVNSQVTMIAKEGFGEMSPELLREIESTGAIIKHRAHEVVGFVGDSQLSEVQFRSATNHRTRDMTPAQSAYVLIGGTADTEWLHPGTEKMAMGMLPIERTKGGYIKTDVQLRKYGAKLPFETSLPGVFAAGDIRKNALRRVGQAVGQGVAAVASMERYVANNPHILRDSTSPAYNRTNILKLTGDAGPCNPVEPEPLDGT
ncbi:NAD(P)/FAD-dependent oxidoreductase, partial [Streptomyces gardneri]|uniref:NAD(P)/FAD-dependent oxidoreductase n=1 Tax=Streptomyces gardneri TaxID=66892 RepID=UPI0037CE9DCD